MQRLKSELAEILPTIDQRPQVMIEWPDPPSSYFVIVAVLPQREEQYLVQWLETAEEVDMLIARGPVLFYLAPKTTAMAYLENVPAGQPS